MFRIREFDEFLTESQISDFREKVKKKILPVSRFKTYGGLV